MIPVAEATDDDPLTGPLGPAWPIHRSERTRGMR